MGKFQTKWHQRVPNSLGDPTWESVDGQWTIVRVASKCRDRKAKFEIRQFGTYPVTICTVGAATIDDVKLFVDELAFGAQ